MKAEELGNEEVTCSDRISDLPDDLLFRILSLVPVRIALSTSLLSKRWNYVWKMMPTLVYDETCPYNGSLGFDQFCRMSLPLHEAPVLKTLNIKLGEYSDSIDTLLFPNIRSILLEIIITLNYHQVFYSPIRFPNNLKVFKTLLVLKLEGRIAVDVVDSPVCFPSLKILHVTRVRFQYKEESFKRVLSACPVLEDLYLQRLCSLGRFMFTISVPTLQRLSIDTQSVYHCYDDLRFEINTPSLNNLKINDRGGCFNFVEDMPKLVEANISLLESETGKLMKASHLKGTLISKRILHLELHIYDTIQLSLLTHLLEEYPKLRSLKLNQNHWFPKRGVEDQPRSVPECLSFHLETLEWIGYAGTLEENEVATYILKNAHCLKTATISLYSTDTEKRMLIEKELRSMTKGSCQLVILLLDY
uniref:F-box domain-containing protein n=1 Tax=Brassica campestris TaxID=3711 RepID=M4CRL3_BRACM